MHTLFTNIELRIAKVGVYNADILIIQGVRFEVINEWNNMDYPTHYYDIIIKIDDDNFNQYFV